MLSTLPALRRRSSRCPGRSHRQRQQAGEPLGMLNAGDAVEAVVEDAREVVPEEVLRDDELVILAIRPSILFIPLSSLAWLTAVAILMLALAWMARFPAIPWSDAVAFALGAVAMFARLAWGAIDWATRLYILTDRRVIVRQGVARVRHIEHPLREVHTVRVIVCESERPFGLGTIGFASGTSTVFDARWDMIARPFEVHAIVMETLDRYR
jgi:hypothetical protein